MSTVLWWLCISFNFYQVAVNEKTSSDLLRCEIKYNYFVWIYSLILTAVTATMGDLVTNHNGSWECWIDPVDSRSQWLYYYLHMAIALFFGILLWPLGLYRICALHWSSHLDHRIWNYIRHVLFIVMFATFFIFIICFRIAGNNASQALAILHMLAVCGIGLYCAIVFGISVENFKFWRNICYRDARSTYESNDSSVSSELESKKRTHRSSQRKKEQFEYSPKESTEKHSFKSPDGGGVQAPPTDISAITSVSINNQNRRLQSRIDAVNMRLEDVDSPGTPVLSQPLLDDS